MVEKMHPSRILIKTRLWLVSILLLCSMKSISQDANLTLSVKGGIGQTDMIGKAFEFNRFGYNLENESFNSIYRATFCFDFTYKWNKFLNLNTGINFRKKGFKIDSDLWDQNGNTVGNATTLFQHNYLTLPMRVEINTGKRLNFSFSVGPYIGLLLKSSSDTEISTIGQIDPSDITKEYKPIDLGLSSSIGLKYPVSEKVLIAFSITNEFGLSDIRSSENSNRYAIKTHLLAFEFGLGYSL